MLAVISPAKTLDFESSPKTNVSSVPDFLDQSELLIERLRTLSEQELSSLMSISPKLASLNRQRYHDWCVPFSSENAKQAMNTKRQTGERRIGVAYSFRPFQRLIPLISIHGFTTHPGCRLCGIGLHMLISRASALSKRGND